MGGTGLENTPFSPEKQAACKVDGADLVQVDTRLAKLVDAWPRFGEATRDAITTMLDCAAVNGTADAE